MPQNYIFLIKYLFILTMIYIHYVFWVISKVNLDNRKNNIFLILEKLT